MNFEKEIKLLGEMVSYSLRETEIRNEIIYSLRETNHSNLWESYCSYLTEQRATRRCNPAAINIVDGLCKKINPPGRLMKDFEPKE